MSKAVLISIRPEWCEKIANGAKTIEVRKTRPKIEAPFRCYIYCTMPKTKDPHQVLEIHGVDGKIRKANGKIIGEFVCDSIETYPRRITRFEKTQTGSFVSDEEISKTCLSVAGLNDYLMGHPAYFWHISALYIYDKPRELSEFAPVCKFKQDDGTCPTRLVACSYQNCDYNQDGSINLVECGRRITRPPQSWCYVEEAET